MQCLASAYNHFPEIAQMFIGAAGLVTAIAILVQAIRRRYRFRHGDFVVDIYTEDDIPERLEQVLRQSLPAPRPPDDQSPSASSPD